MPGALGNIKAWHVSIVGGFNFRVADYSPHP